MGGSLQHITLLTSNPNLLMISSDAISIALIEELNGTLERNTVYDLERSMEVKLENLPGLTSSTKPHSAGWTP